VQLVYDEPRGENPRFIVIKKGGIVTRDEKITQGKIIEDSGIRKATEKTQMFDENKERKM
jgi:hypothetical protein